MRAIRSSHLSIWSPDVWRKVHVMKLLFMKFSLSFCYSLPLPLSVQNSHVVPVGKDQILHPHKPKRNALVSHSRASGSIKGRLHMRFVVDGVATRQAFLRLPSVFLCWSLVRHCSILIYRPFPSCDFSDRAYTSVKDLLTALQSDVETPTHVYILISGSATSFILIKQNGN
jgi:hypothetical protein